MNPKIEEGRELVGFIREQIPSAPPFDKIRFEATAATLSRALDVCVSADRRRVAEDSDNDYPVYKKNLDAALAEFDFTEAEGSECIHFTPTEE